MKKIIRLTESDLHKIIMGSVKRIIKEDFDQFSDGDFASEGNPYEMDTYNPISEVEHITPQDLRNIYVWETGDSYYEFEADYGHSGFGRQMNQSDVQSSQFDEWFNTTLGDHLARVIYNKIDNGDFANDAESGY